jgi:hypothetical protein
MKWFDNWILKKANLIRENEDKVETKWAMPSSRTLSKSSIGDSLDSPAVRFKMFKASGGTIIETTIYDDNRDRHITGLYVITNDKDIGTEISKILTMESLKI